MWKGIAKWKILGTQWSTTSTALQWSAPQKWVIFCKILIFLLLFFIFFFDSGTLKLEPYKVFQLNWIDGVAYGNSACFYTNFKETCLAEQTILEGDFDRSKFFRTQHSRGEQDGKFSIEVWKKFWTLSSYAKVMIVLPKQLRGMFSEGWNWLERVEWWICICHGNN
jgi:hypothetical protein